MRICVVHHPHNPLNHSVPILLPCLKELNFRKECASPDDMSNSTLYRGEGKILFCEISFPIKFAVKQVHTIEMAIVLWQSRELLLSLSLSPTKLNFCLTRTSQML